MKQIIEKLCADLNDRLKKKSTRPRPEELERWAPIRIPFLAPPLASIGFFIFCLAGSGLWTSLMGRDLAFILLGPYAVFIFIVTAFMARPRLNNHFIRRAYRAHLDKNERFVLFEYSKYLKRKIEAAKSDLSLGGAEEVRRLRELHGKIVELLQRGTAGETPAVASNLSDEALVAQSVIETFEATQTDPLKTLDDRLPEELRLKVAELDQELGERLGGREAEG